MGSATGMGRILVAAQNAELLQFCTSVLEPEGFSVRLNSNAAEVQMSLQKGEWEVLCLEDEIAQSQPFNWIKKIARQHFDLNILLMGNHPTSEEIRRAIQLPVSAYLFQPIQAGTLLFTVLQGVEKARLMRQLKQVRHQTLYNINAGLTDLCNLTEAILFNRNDQLICRLLDCPRSKILTEALQETILVLANTKNAFKSKELGSLRHRLELVLSKVEKD